MSGTTGWLKQKLKPNGSHIQYGVIGSPV